jgi:hypothetical protein
MIDLQPFVARFIDDVLRAIRKAPLEELREVLANGQADPPAKRPRLPASKPEGPAQRAARPTPRKSVRQPRAMAAPLEAMPELESAADITDPERLLAAAVAEPNGAVSAQEAFEGAEEEEPPASTARPTAGAAVVLRAGESLVRAAGVGLVIRRQKRA